MLWKSYSNRENCMPMILFYILFRVYFGSNVSFENVVRLSIRLHKYQIEWCTECGEMKADFSSGGEVCRSVQSTLSLIPFSK
jgi:hypothetical protein